MHKQATSNPTHKTYHSLNLKGAHHSFPYNILVISDGDCFKMANGSFLKFTMLPSYETHKFVQVGSFVFRPLTIVKCDQMD